MWEEVLLFLVTFQVKLLSRFLRLFGLSHFGVFNTISLYIYAIKCLIYIHIV